MKLPALKILAACVFASTCVAQDGAATTTLEPAPTAALAGEDERPESAVRIWHDRTGTSSVEAKLIDVSDRVVRLLKVEGNQVIEVPLEKLSLADREYCATVLQQLEGDQPDGDKDDAPINAPPDQFERGHRALIDAVQTYQAAVKALVDEDVTSAEYQVKHRVLVQDFLKAVNGQKLRIHFAVRDVQRVSGSHVEIFLTNCELAATRQPGSIRLRMSPAEWRRIQKGAVVRIDGTVNERTPRDLAALAFQFGGYGEKGMLAGVFPGRPQENGAECNITVYANDFRVLRDDEAAALEEERRALEQ